MVRKKIVALIVILSTVANVILFCTKNASACEIQKEYIDTMYGDKVVDDLQRLYHSIKNTSALKGEPCHE